MHLYVTIYKPTWILPQLKILHCEVFVSTIHRYTFMFSSLSLGVQFTNFCTKNHGLRTEVISTSEVWIHSWDTLSYVQETPWTCSRLHSETGSFTQGHLNNILMKMTWKLLNACKTQKTPVETYYWVQSKLSQISQIWVYKGLSYPCQKLKVCSRESACSTA